MQSLVERLAIVGLSMGLVISGGCGSSGSDNGGGAGGSSAAGSGGRTGTGGSGSGSPGSGGSSAAGGSSGNGGATGSGGASAVGTGGASGGGDAAAETGGGTPDATGGGSTAMSFFITSKGLGKGGDLGGLAGADAHCLALAKAAGSTKTKWAAYLSASKGSDGMPVHARTRIGTGPWYNAKGVMIAKDLEQLHANSGAMNGINEDNGLDEAGKVVPGRNEAKRPAGTSNEHDIVTGSTIEGMLSPDTCMDWTSAATTVKAAVGHHDKMGPSPGTRMEWNAAHATSGCAEGKAAGGIGSGGGRGSFYCFAAD